MKTEGSLQQRLIQLREKIAIKRYDRLQIVSLSVHQGEFDAETILVDPAFKTSTSRRQEWAQIQNLKDSLAILKRELALLTKDENVVEQKIF